MSFSTCTQQTVTVMVKIHSSYWVLHRLLGLLVPQPSPYSSWTTDLSALYQTIKMALINNDNFKSNDLAKGFLKKQEKLEWRELGWPDIQLARLGHSGWGLLWRASQAFGDRVLQEPFTISMWRHLNKKNQLILNLIPCRIPQLLSLSQKF